MFYPSFWQPVVFNLSVTRFVVPVATSRLSASFPSPADDHVDTQIDLMHWMVPHPSATYWWRVSGDCLTDIGIMDGDLVAVDRSGKARLGRAVVAEIDGDMTAKILQRRNGKLQLMPANVTGGFKALDFTESTKIWGVIAGVCRRYDVD